jgi:beta-phosphoglucomutase-like phosphatase (HAD superfamily)
VLPVPGVVRLLRELHRSGIALALATSASTGRARCTLSELGVQNCFQNVLAAEDVAVGKPDPAIYTLATDRLKIAPQDVLAVEDAVSGVRAAVAAGLCCLAVALHQEPKNLIAAGAAYVIRDFENFSCGDMEGILRGGKPLLSRSAALGRS